MDSKTTPEHQAEPSPAASQPDSNPAINQKAIAKLLGLSTATVSRSLRNDDSIRATTRARVFQAARQLGYRIPEARRGAVRTRQIKTLQLLVGSATGLGPAGDEIIAGISEAASAHDAQLSVFVSPLHSGGSLAGDFEPPAMRAGLVDGAILLHSFASEVVADLANRMPVVSMVHRFDGLPIDCIDTDERLGVARLFGILHLAGHQKIGYVTMGDANKSWDISRLSGFREACMRNELPPSSTPILSLKSNLNTSGEVAQQIHQHVKQGVTAWICACDPVAYTLNGELRNLGLSIGKDVVVAGFDGLPPPPGEVQIPTIRVPYRDLGGAAVRRLAHRMECPTSRIRDILLRHDFIAGYLDSSNIPAATETASVPALVPHTIKQCDR